MINDYLPPEEPDQIAQYQDETDICGEAPWYLVSVHFEYLDDVPGTRANYHSHVGSYSKQGH